jgi:hypothetical protein
MLSSTSNRTEKWIQINHRMKFRFFFINSTIIVLAVLFTGCASTPKVSKISGQILVNDNGQIQKTGNAPIWIYDATNADLAISNVPPNFGGRGRQDWKRIVAAYPNSLNAYSNYEAAVQNASANETKYRDVNQKYWDKKQALNGQTNGQTNGPDFELVQQLEANAKQALTDKELAWDKDDDSRELIFYWYGVNPEILYAGLPEPLALAQTDTNGNFSIELPKSKKVLLAVHIQGAVNSQPGDYFWLVPLTSGDANSSHLVLNGDNARARKVKPTLPVIILPEANGYIGNIGFSTQSQNRMRDRGTPY